MKKRGFRVNSALEIAKDCIWKGWVLNITTMKKVVNGSFGVSKVDEANELIEEIKEMVSDEPCTCEK